MCCLRRHVHKERMRGRGSVTEGKMTEREESNGAMKGGRCKEGREAFERKSDGERK